jgi:hypothetical protein
VPATRSATHSFATGTASSIRTCPNLSLLEARQLDVQTKPAWLTHLGEIWEEIVRTSIPNVSIDDA